MENPIKVLAIDGGGVRGIIPAMVLAEVENRTQKHIADLFDLFAGTSTGAILALGLLKPNRRASFTDPCFSRFIPWAES